MYLTILIANMGTEKCKPVKSRYTGLKVLEAL